MVAVCNLLKSPLQTKSRVITTILTLWILWLKKEKINTYIHHIPPATQFAENTFLFSNSNPTLSFSLSLSLSVALATQYLIQSEGREQSRMDLEVVGRHALLFDDDATAAFINTSDALVEWNSLSIDRYDVRHLLSSPPPPRKLRRHHRSEDPSLDSELDRERYLDLPSPSDEDQEQGKTITAWFCF